MPVTTMETTNTCNNHRKYPSKSGRDSMEKAERFVLRNGRFFDGMSDDGKWNWRQLYFAGFDWDDRESEGQRGEAGQETVRPRGLHRLASHEGHSTSSGPSPEEQHHGEEVWIIHKVRERTFTKSNRDPRAPRLLTKIDHGKNNDFFSNADKDFCVKKRDGQRWMGKEGKLNCPKIIHI